MLKRILAVVVLLLAAVATLPWWGGCDLNARVCSTWCNVKNPGGEMKAAACRASCSLESTRCHGAKAAKDVGNFMKGN